MSNNTMMVNGISSDMREKFPVATTIIDQLGNVRLMTLMVCAKFFVAQDGLAMVFSGNSETNYMTIKLNAMDLYDVTFFVNGNQEEHDFFNEDDSTIEEIVTSEVYASFTDVFCENLVPLFEETTGLLLSMGQTGKTVWHIN